jgi:hypothetical protein
MTEQKEEYWEKLKQFNQWRNAIVQGVATGEEEEYLALRAWLREHFEADFVDLF